jgi:hypothetical protein
MSAVPRSRGDEEPRHRAFRRLGRHLRRSRRGTMEISPDGKTLKPRSRFAKFVNLPELQQMFRAFADVQTAEMLDLPRPKLGRRQADVVACPMSDEQQPPSSRSWSNATNASARRRSTRGRTTPWPSPPTAASSPSMPGCSPPGRRLPRLEGQRPGGECRFPSGSARPRPRNADDLLRHGCESRPPGATRSTTRSPQKLVASGHPPRADRRHRRCRLRRQEAGPVRESPQRPGPGADRQHAKMGTGTNVQKRLVALHHLDAPGSRPRSSSGRAASSGRATRTRKSRSTVTSPKGLRRLYVAGVGDQGAVHRPGDDGRKRRSAVPRTSAGRN